MRDNLPSTESSSTATGRCSFAAQTHSLSSLLCTTNVLEHRRVLQHVRQDDEAHLRSTHEDILQRLSAAVAQSHCDFGHLAVHVVFGLDELAAIDFT